MHAPLGFFKSQSAKTRVYISFDYDHDADLKNLLVGQARNEDSPFEIVDMSLKEELSGDWQVKVRPRIKGVDLVIVICGQYTDTATGVNAELRIAREEGIPYFFLNGRSDKYCVKPTAAYGIDKIYIWSWPILQQLINGAR
jgi:hypothetical protein